LQAQAEAALAMLHELKAEPRPETLAVALVRVQPYISPKIELSADSIRRKFSRSASSANHRFT
jgi:hypothetical protein